MKNCFFLLSVALISLNSVTEQRGFEEDKSKELEQKFLKNDGKSMTYEEFIELIKEYGDQAADIFSSMNINIKLKRSKDEYDKDTWRTIIRVVTDDLGCLTNDVIQVDMVKTVVDAVKKGIAQVDNEAGIYGQCCLIFLGSFDGNVYYAYISSLPQNDDVDVENQTVENAQSA